MTQTQHTPGPWHLGADGRIVYDARGWAISNAVTFHGRHNEGEDRGNARLIAAAPDLLEALKLASESLCNLAEEAHPTIKVEMYEAVRAARAAIAKAEGRS